MDIWADTAAPTVGYHRPQPEIAVQSVISSGADGSQVVFQIGDQQLPASINLPGGYNIYNACAAMAAGRALGLDAKTAADSLSHFACGFGRMENSPLGRPICG